MLRKSSLIDSLYKQGSSPYLPSQKQSAGCSAGSACLVRRHEESSFKSVFVLCTEVRYVLQYKPLSYALWIPGTKTLRGAWCQHTGLDFERIIFIAEVTFGDWSCATPKLMGNCGRVIAHPGSVSQS